MSDLIKATVQTLNEMYHIDENQENAFDLVEKFISEEEYNSLSEEEQEDYIPVEQLDELMGKGSLEKIRDAHGAAAGGRSSKTSDFHLSQNVRANHIINKRDTRAKYGKDAQHYHQYGSDSKQVKGQYAKMGKAAKAKVTKNLGKEYSGKDKAPGMETAGKTTIHNPPTKAQTSDREAKTTAYRKKIGLDK